MTKKFDDSGWHTGGDFPADLPPEAGATHIAMFFAWAILSGIGDNDELGDLAEIRPLLLERKMTPGNLFLQFRDGKFLDRDLNGEGRSFANVYYEGANYIADYDDALGADNPTLYHVPDSWTTFDKLREILDRRFDEWKRGDLQIG